METNIKTDFLPTDNEHASTRYITNAIELVLSLGDFQEEIRSECTPQSLTSQAIERLCHLVAFKASAIYLVDEETSDMDLSVCVPISLRRRMDEELEFMIQNGFVAWALRESRGIIVSAKDGKHQILLHVISTYSRIRGLFVGMLPATIAVLPDSSLEIISLILRNAANGIESLLYSSMLRRQKQNLQEEVHKKTQQIVKYEKQLVQAQKTEAIGALAGGVAHQFNNALTGLTGNIDLIAMVVSQESKILPYIERCRPIIERMSNLTNQLLAYARGGTFIFPQIISLKDLLSEILPGIKNVLKETIHMTTEFTDAEATLEVDLLQIRTAVLAVVNNANEAIADEGTLHLRSTLLSAPQLPEDLADDLKPGNYACIEIQDSGAGMDADTLRRLFEPVFSTKFEGRGLSMAAVSGIVKSHHGVITASSSPGEGTTVSIYLPTLMVP
jgi:signal transduction histidine kinase